MKNKISPNLGLIIATAGILLTQNSTAHHVYDYDDASGSVGTLGSLTWFTTADGNDAFADTFRDDRNSLSINKSFDFAGQPFDTRFLVEAFEELEPNVTEYAVTETITNNTGSPIGAITLQLGFLTAGSFVFSANPDGLDFDQEAEPSHASGLDTPIPQSTTHTTVLDFSTLTETVTLTLTGAVAPGETFNIQYQLDVPSLFLDIDSGLFNIPNAYIVAGDASAVTAAGFDNVPGDPYAGGYQFTLRQTLQPVPIPGAVWLMGSGLLALVTARRSTSA